PEKEDQKLVYAGKLLHDHHSGRELLPKHRKLHALHLVSSLKTPANMQEANAKVLTQSFSRGQQQVNRVFTQITKVLDSRCWMPAPYATLKSLLERTWPPFGSVAPAFSAYTTYSMLQMSWFQQIYARLYYMQYLASLGASADQSHAHQDIQVAPVTPPAPLPDPFPAQNQPGNQNAAAQVNAVGNQNLQMNAQGGPLMEEEEGANRDWLDWLYSAILFYVFINIIYFYSTLRRFLLVMGGTVLMYLHHVGWFPFGQRAVQPFPGNVPPRNVNQDQNNNLQGGNAGRAEGAEASPEEGQVLQELQDDDPSFMSTAWIFFKTFFASLLP
ncbi:HERP1 protein, partial [Bucco capensis]|nr:HERP1 protein [Bucco capensis]